MKQSYGSQQERPLSFDKKRFMKCLKFEKSTNSIAPARSLRSSINYHLSIIILDNISPDPAQ